MEMHQLRYVVAVAKTRNFSRAAESCDVSHPSRVAKSNYRSLESPRPGRTIVAAWLKQRPPGRAAIEFVKSLKARTIAAVPKANE